MELLSENIFWLIILCLISAIYYLNSKSDSMPRRLLVSGHGITIAIGFLFAIFVRPYTAHGNDDLASYLFLSLFGIAACLIMISFIFFKGKKIIHLLQIPNLTIGVTYLLYGSLLIGHDSI